MRDEWHVEDILMQLPKDVQGIGEEVLHAISCSRQLVSWNDKLQLVIHNRSVPRTNIFELVQYILYPENKDTSQPRGFDVFLEALKEIGLESQWVRNETVINALDNNENEWNTTDDDSVSSSASDIEEEEVNSNKISDNNDSDSSMESSDELNEKQSNINWKNFSSSSDDTEN